jgi:hypothetical protein
MRRIEPRTLLSLLSLLLAPLLLAACAAPQTSAGAEVEAPPKSRPLPAEPMPSPRPGAVAGVPVLDRSCKVDTDCAVKDVGSCCGYRPACVNKDAKPDPAAVQAACAANGVMGTCGFREIEACSCVANTCEAAGSAAVAR